ncbi:unnamed protein product [Amoebophrya sp. A25]|nr:unnamed protein product [Amoebophrya sp. A25]|eukprot:GSA25T00011163001.1
MQTCDSCSFALCCCATRTERRGCCGSTTFLDAKTLRGRPEDAIGFDSCYTTDASGKSNRVVVSSQRQQKNSRGIFFLLSPAGTISSPFHKLYKYMMTYIFVTTALFHVVNCAQGRRLGRKVHVHPHAKANVDGQPSSSSTLLGRLNGGQQGQPEKGNQQAFRSAQSPSPSPSGLFGSVEAEENDITERDDEQMSEGNRMEEVDLGQ